MRNRIALAASIGLLLAPSGPAFAADGQIAINMARVMAGNVTPGDAPGFPVTIAQPGSYILTGNLTVADARTTAILIVASHVTIDLNGFAILGPVDCSGSLQPCAGVAPPFLELGSGIATTTRTALFPPQFNITIRNGTIQGMGNAGIFLTGDSNVIEKVRVRSNGLSGIYMDSSSDSGSSLVEDCTVQRNGGVGIFVLSGVARHNIVDVNLTGVIVVAGSALHNLANRNLFAGLKLDAQASAYGNTMIDNPGGNLDGGFNLGRNFCSGAGGGC